MIARSFIALVLALVAVFACRRTPELAIGEETGVVMRLPLGAGRFLGQPEEPGEDERKLLPQDTEMAKMLYRTTALDPAARDLARVSIVLAGAERRSIHRPEVCLQGQGWRLVSATTMSVEVLPGRKMEVRDLLIEKRVTLDSGEARLQRAHYAYWFVGADITTASHLDRTLLSIRDSVLRNVNHRWAYASVMAFVTDNFKRGETGERLRGDSETRALVAELIREITPHFQKDCMKQGAE